MRDRAFPARLSGEDASWLHMEDETNPMVINALMELGAPVQVADVRALLARSLPARFSCRVEEPRLGFGSLRLVRAVPFDVGAHVEAVALPSSEDALTAFVGAQVGMLLDRDAPLFRVYVILREGENTMLFFRVHHALADGFALLDLLLSLAVEDRSANPAAVTHGARVTSPLDYAASLGRLTFLPRDPRTVLKNPLGTEKHVAWTPPLSLPHIKAIGKAASATTNDVLVSAVAGAVGELLHTHMDDARDVRAMVPVNLRAAGANGGLGNRFGLVVLSLPVGIIDPRERLLTVKRRMDRLKATPEAIVAMGLLRAMGQAPRWLEDLGVGFFGKKASLVLTNVPGPRTRLHLRDELGGVPIERIMFWVPQAAKMGLGVSIFSYAGYVTIGVLADAHVTPAPADIVASVVRQLS